MSKVMRYTSEDKEKSLSPGKGVSTVNDFLLRPIFLMTDPRHSDPNPALRRERLGGKIDNKKTEASNYAAYSPQKTQLQHTRLRALKCDLGASVILDSGQPGQIDGVYAADPSITFMHLQIEKGKITGVHFDTVASLFYLHYRQGEVTRQINSITFLKRFLSENFGLKLSSRVHMPKIHGEGTGDNVYDPFRDMFFSGFKQKSEEFSPDQGRSDPEFHEKILRGIMGVPTFGSEMQNGCFHFDTAGAPLGKGDIALYPGGMTKDDFEKIKTRVAADQKNLIVVSEKDALLYAPNLTLISQDDIISGMTSRGFRDDVTEAGYNIHQTELDQFVEQSGGGAHCLGNRIILRRDELQEALRLLNYSL